MKPTIGRIVHYSLTAADAEKINRSRIHTYDKMDLHVGNEVKEGQVFPLMITAVWGDKDDSAFNGQLFLDGNDVVWITSTSVGEGPSKCAWPKIDGR